MPPAPRLPVRLAPPRQDRARAGPGPPHCDPDHHLRLRPPGPVSPHRRGSHPERRPFTTLTAHTDNRREVPGKVPGPENLVLFLTWPRAGRSCRRPYEVGTGVTAGQGGQLRSLTAAPPTAGPPRTGPARPPHRLAPAHRQRQKGITSDRVAGHEQANSPGRRPPATPPAVSESHPTACPRRSPAPPGRARDC